MDYEFELNMDETYKDEDCIDMWGMAYVWVDKTYGAEYNYCIEDGENYSAIYLIRDWETDTSCFEHYEIEWDKEDWEDRLKNKMIEFVKEKKSENL